MRPHHVFVSLLALTVGASALADAPRVVTDISPVHGLVARVMEGIGEPSQIIRPGASPHGYAMRPSEASALAEAEIVVWIGEALTPWLEEPIETLAPNAHHLELMSVDGITVLDVRTGATFDEHDHDHGHDDHGHNDHKEEGHDEHGHDEHAHDDHKEEGHDDHGHDDHADGSVDGHAWLSPANALLWLDVIADELAEHDPENAAAYMANAAAAKTEIETVTASVQARMAELSDARFLVFHDAYQYFEQSFGLEAAGSISLGDASDPSPARIAEVRVLVAETGVTCAFAEPQYNSALVDTVLEGTDARTGILDLLGTDIPAGPGFYVALIDAMATNLEACLRQN